MRMCVDSTSFQSRVKFDKNMSKSEKEYAKAILNEPMYSCGNNTSNKKLLKKYNLNLDFISNPNKLTTMGIGYTPSFNEIYKDKDSNIVHKRFDCGSGWQREMNDIYLGAIRLKQTLDIANAVKNSPRHNTHFTFTNFWQGLKGYFKIKLGK